MCMSSNILKVQKVSLNISIENYVNSRRNDGFSANHKFYILIE